MINQNYQQRLNNQVKQALLQGVIDPRLFAMPPNTTGKEGVDTASTSPFPVNQFMFQGKNPVNQGPANQIFSVDDASYNHPTGLPSEGTHGNTNRFVQNVWESPLDHHFEEHREAHNAENLSSFCSIASTPMVAPVGGAHNNSKKISIQGTPMGLFAGSPNNHISFAEVERLFKNTGTPFGGNVSELSPFWTAGRGGDNSHQDPLVLENGLVMNPLKRMEPKKDKILNLFDAGGDLLDGSNLSINQQTPGDQIKLEPDYNAVYGNLPPLHKEQLGGHQDNSHSVSQLFTNPLPKGGSHTLQSPTGMLFPSGNVVKTAGNQPWTNTNNGGIETEDKATTKPKNAPFTMGGKTTMDINSMIESLSKLSLKYSKNPTLTPNSRMAFMSKVNQLAKDAAEGKLATPVMQSNGGRIGAYTREERMSRIMRYKNKIKKWRNAHPVKRKFAGRSKVAGEKPRLHGRFVKMVDQSKQIRKGDKKDIGDMLAAEFEEKTTIH